LNDCERPSQQIDRKEYEGKVFGNWTVIPTEERITNKHGSTMLVCWCKCGREALVLPYMLRTGRTHGCYWCAGKARTDASRAKGWSLEERFWKKVEKTDTCWLWTGAKIALGYGKIGVGRQSPRLAHRVSYELAYGEFPKELAVCHKCDNPSCVRPDHLFLGTTADNQRDMKEKGRSTIGSRNPRAKLNEEQVVDIFQRSSSASSDRELAKEYGVSAATIQMIRSRRTWTHVTRSL
jgi:hypothetical protein